MAYSSGRRTYGSGRSNAFSWQTTVPRPASPPRGSLLQTLRLSEIHDRPELTQSDKEVGITDCQCVGSYNWLDRRDRKIIIPGCPPAWTPPVTTSALKQDSGQYYRDQNAARSPLHPLEPAVRALIDQSPELSIKDINLFACSSTMGSLVRFVRSVDKTFRFFVEVLGDTAFFIRHEDSPTQFIPDVHGYGHTFPEAYTTWNAEVKGSASHQRILKYWLGGLQCILRFECDGYIKTMADDNPSTTTQASASSAHRTSDISDLFGDFNVDTQPSELRTSNALQIEHAGHQVPQASIFDLKTRSARKINTVLEEELPRCWVAQIPNFIVARHDRGMFNDIKITNVVDKVKQWQQDSQPELRKLVQVIQQIVDAAKKRSNKKLEVCCNVAGVLELREQDTDKHNVLPTDLKSLWQDDRKGPRKP